jgi:hypothetical protein
MAIIDVLIVVDAARVLQDHGHNTGARTGNYVLLKNTGTGYIFMLTEYADVKSAEGISELNMRAKKGDIIRWRMTSMTMGNTYQCFITHFVVNQGPKNITPPEAKHEKISIPVTDPDHPDRVILSNSGDFYWESTVLTNGPVTYHTKFCICGDSGGGGGGGGGGDCNDNPSDCGGFQWDPFINT